MYLFLLSFLADRAVSVPVGVSSPFLALSSCVNPGSELEIYIDIFEGGRQLTSQGNSFWKVMCEQLGMVLILEKYSFRDPSHLIFAVDKQFQFIFLWWYFVLEVITKGRGFIRVILECTAIVWHPDSFWWPSVGLDQKLISNRIRHTRNLAGRHLFQISFFFHPPPVLEPPETFYMLVVDLEDRSISFLS